MAPQKLAELAIGGQARIREVGGERPFRRRLLELGLVPGTVVELVSIAPLGDPLELLVRGACLSIRRQEAVAIEVERVEPVRQQVSSAKPVGAPAVA